MVVTAVRLLRKMRGGAQAHLVAADDGRCYVVKFRNNPQHRRILVNEWIGSSVLRYLQIAAPEPVLVRITDEFAVQNPDAGLQLGTRREAIELGWHYGSLYPGDPDRVAVYDFLPDKLLGQVENRQQLLGVLVVDKWLSNADSRQCVFFRARLRDWCADSQASPLKMGFVALMIDHGYLFSGPHWSFQEAPLQGLYHRPMVYAGVQHWQDFEPWLGRVEHFPDEEFDRALRQIPSVWLEEGEREELGALLELAIARRSQVRRMLQECCAARPQFFPKWSAQQQGARP